jgi:hypothetical protein
MGDLRYRRRWMTPATPAEDVARDPEPESTESAVVADAPVSVSPFVTASHELLFAPEPPACDACGTALDAAAEDEGGLGLYIWARNGEVVYEEPPLCASCAAAITITALQRWEIEEEEG